MNEWGFKWLRAQCWLMASIFGTSIMMYNAKVCKYGGNFTLHPYVHTLPKEHWAAARGDVYTHVKNASSVVQFCE